MDTNYLARCIETLEKAFSLLQKSDSSTIEYDMYRSASIKEFELILEQSGKLLKKRMKPFFHSSKSVDKLNFKEIFRHAALHSLISIDESERWMLYRDNRNNTAHDYGIGFAEDTIKLLPEFITDSKNLVSVLNDFQES